MADETQAMPAPPQKGQIVSDQALYMSQISLYRNSMAFGGLRNPSEMWSTMVYNHPQAMLLYRELEEKDEDIANCLDTLRLGVLERDRQLTPGDDSQQAAEVVAFIQDQLDNLPEFHTVLDCILDAPGYGFSVQELIFDESEGQASISAINDCPQELFLFGDRYQPQIGQLQFLSQPWAASGAPVPEEKFIVFTYRKRGRNRMGRPLLKSVFWPSWFKRNIQRLWLQYAEKGPGTAVVRYQDADSESERRRAAELAQSIVERTAVGVPATFQIELDLLKSARAMDPAVYQKFFDAMQYSIARKILGETLTSFGNEGGTGAKAQGEVHAETLNTRIVELCRSVADVVNRQLIRPLVLWNFGPQAPMPKWQFDLGEEEDLQQRSQIDAQLQKMGKKFTAGYIAKRYQVPLVEDEDPDDALTPIGGGAVTPPPDEPDPDDPDADEDDDAKFHEGERELKEVDSIMAQLRDGVDPLLRSRTRRIVDSAIPVHVAE
jgi:phage gp29-like protein